MREDGRRARGEAGWEIDASGLLAAARFISSPNFDRRPEGSRVELVVVHNISLPPGEFGGEGVIELFTNRLDAHAHPYYREVAGLKVSPHFLIRRGGELIQFVPCGSRAWHAGQSEWRGRSRCNDFSIGIELEGTDAIPFTDAQYDALTKLARALRSRYPIVDWAGHADVARPAGRKTDPGPHFDWARFRRMIA